MAPDAAPFLLDTAYVYVLVNTRDHWHAAAVQWETHVAAERRRLVTTEFVLLEPADGLAAVRFRSHAAGIITLLRTSSLVEIVPASSRLFAAALELYRSRSDKDWGLTDCSSFVVIGEYGMSAALTTDEHFRQAGFHPLLLENRPDWPAGPVAMQPGKMLGGLARLGHGHDAATTGLRERCSHRPSAEHHGART